MRRVVRTDGGAYCWRVALVVLLMAGSGCRDVEEETATFQAEQKAAAAGYSLEHFPKERLLFVHRPGGDKTGVDLAQLQRAYIYRLPAKESTDGKTKYWLHFDAKEHTLFAPFFGIDPDYVVDVLKLELADFDEPMARKMIETFQKSAASLCVLWVSDAYLKELGGRREQQCTP